MPTTVFKLFAGQGTGRRDGQSSNYMLPLLGISYHMILFNCFHLTNFYFKQQFYLCISSISNTVNESYINI